MNVGLRSEILGKGHSLIDTNPILASEKQRAASAACMLEPHGGETGIGVCLR